LILTWMLLQNDTKCKYCSAYLLYFAPISAVCRFAAVEPGHSFSRITSPI
jgi:hypothetical protein